MSRLVGLGHPSTTATRPPGSLFSALLSKTGGDPQIIRVRISYGFLESSIPNIIDGDVHHLKAALLLVRLCDLLLN